MRQESHASLGGHFPPCLHLEFPGDSAELGRVRAALRDYLSAAMDVESIEQVVVAIDEACTNIIRHALRGNPSPVQLECRLEPGLLGIVLRDFGTPCDPSLLKGRSLEDIRPGGLGVHIIKKVFDRVEYAPQPVGSKLFLEKRI